MPDLFLDEKGFTCECGTRNDYPAYVMEHWDVHLVYTCECRRRFVLYQGRVRKVRQEPADQSMSDAFGD